MPDPQAFDSEPNGDMPFAGIGRNRTPLMTDPFAPDPQDPTLDGGQVLYHTALGAQPEDFHPALQPLAQGYRTLFQPRPAQGPGLLESSGNIPASVAQSASTSAPAMPGPAQSTDAQTPSVDDDNQDGGLDGEAQAYGPGAPAPTAIQRLRAAQDAALANKDFAPGAKNQPSHCNQATYSIARGMGADTTPFGDGQTTYNANTQVQKLEQAANTPGSGWKRVGLQEAQGHANQGRLAVLGWSNPGGHGHTVTVRPDASGVASNPSLTQIGGLKTGGGNGLNTFRGSFGRDKRGAVKAYVYVGN